jgi:hypothetical protein
MNCTAGKMVKKRVNDNKAGEPKANRSKGSAWFLEALPILVVVIVSSILFLPLILTGKVLFWGTSSTQFIPWLSTAWSDVTHGILPLWNPSNGMGAPLIANYQIAFFYPPIWLTFIGYLIKGNPGLATSAFFLVYLHVIWVGLGMVFLTRKLGMKPFARIVSGLAFALSGCFIARVNFFSMIWAIAWIPWIMLTCLTITQQILDVGNKEGKLVRGKRFSNYLLLVVLIALQILAGHAQVTWYTFLFAITWMGFWGWQNGSLKGAVKSIIVMGVCSLAAALLTAVQLIPTLEYLLQTPRAASINLTFALNYSFWPAHLANFFSPEFYGNPARGNYWGFGASWEDAVYFGFIPLFLTFFTIKTWFKEGRPNRNAILFLWIGFTVTLLIALGKYLPIFPFLFRFIPTFNLFQAPARFMIIGVFCLCLLAGFGVEYWLAPTGRGLYVCRLGVMAGVAIFVGSLIGLGTIRGNLVTIVRGSISIGIELIIFCWLTLRIAYSKNSPHTYFTWLGLAVLAISGDLIINSQSLIPFTEQVFYSNPIIQTDELSFGRIWIPANTEYDLKFERFFRFDDFRALEEWENIRRVNLPNTNLLSGINLINNFDPFVPDRYQRLLNVLNNSTGQKQNDLLQLMNVVGVEQIDLNSKEGTKINPVENSKDYRWYECVEFSQNLEDSQSLLTQQMNDPNENIQNTLVVERPGVTGQEECLPAQPIKYESIFMPGNRKEMFIETAHSGWLMISYTYYPGWIALMDGKEIPIYPANIAFQAVQIPAGRHTIQLFYRPQSCYYGAILSASTLFGILTSFIVNKKKKKEDEHGNKNHK